MGRRPGGSPLRHGPWPVAAARDPSNAVSGHPAAIALGHRLFFDPRLSAAGSISCVSCHVPSGGWTDGRARAVGLAAVDRNTPTILDVALHRWFSWDGRADSLWSQSLKPIVDPREMGASGGHVARLVRDDATLACLHTSAFGAPPTSDPERALVRAGKALAAFVDTIRSGRTASMRNLRHTAPYMHDGRYATLRDVVRHYSELDMERIHTHGEQLLRPLKLSSSETDDLVAFLESLTDPAAAQAPAAPAADGCRP